VLDHLSYLPLNAHLQVVGLSFPRRASFLSDVLFKLFVRRSTTSGSKGERCFDRQPFAVGRVTPDVFFLSTLLAEGILLIDSPALAAASFQHLLRVDLAQPLDSMGHGHVMAFDVPSRRDDLLRLQ
jgi:hypothetical protein